MPMFVIEDRDADGYLGVTVFMARDENQAVRKFQKKHPNRAIDEIEQCEWLEMALVDEQGKTAYQRRA